MEEFKQKVLFNKLEYVALFKLNRPVQTTKESVAEFKKSQNAFSELIRTVERSNHERELKWAQQLRVKLRLHQEMVCNLLNRQWNKIILLAMSQYLY